MIAVVVSRADEASEHVGDRLLELADWTEREDDSLPESDGGGVVYRHDPFELRTFDDLHLELEHAATTFSERPELLAFASRHSGDTGPLLTAHFTGNFGPAEFGGRDDALAEAAPGAQAALLESFERYAPEGYDVGMECTHHGPSDVGCPSLFVELGSGESEWRDPAGATAVAKAILDLDGVDPGGDRSVVGFGGGHYVPRFERVVRETPWTVGHVAADWGLDAMGNPDAHRGVLRQAFDASDAECALVEGTKPELEATLESMEYRVVSETWLRTVGAHDIDAVEALEDELSTVEDGLRFGEHAPSGETNDRSAEPWTVRELPQSLVDAARGVDEDATRAAVRKETVAFETRNGGSQVAGRTAFPASDGGDDVSQDADDAYDALVNALVSIVEPAYDEVRREPGRVVAVREAFDPELAHDAGVPEGPKFGRLAGGEPVTVDGEMVKPDAVASRHEDVFET